MSDRNSENLPLGESEETAPGVTVNRRCFMTAAAIALGVGVLPGHRAMASAWTGEQRISLETFLAEVVPIAQELVADKSARGQNHYLHTLAAFAVRLAPLEPPAKLRDISQGKGGGSYIGVHPGGKPFVMLHWKLEPGAEVRLHPHTYGNVVTLSLGGEVWVENYEMVEARDFERTDRFQVRQTASRLLRSGDTNLVSLEHGYVHGFKAGAAGAHGLDLTTRIRPKNPPIYLDVGNKPIDPKYRIFEGSWTQ